MKINKIMLLALVGLSISAKSFGMGIFRRTFTSPKTTAFAASCAAYLGCKMGASVAQADAQDRWQRFSIIRGTSEAHQPGLKEYATSVSWFGKGLNYTLKNSWDILRNPISTLHNFNAYAPYLRIERMPIIETVKRFSNVYTASEVSVKVNLAKCRFEYMFDTPKQLYGRSTNKHVSISCDSGSRTKGDVEYRISDVRSAHREKDGVFEELEPAE